jgi:hypothetical protein
MLFLATTTLLQRYYNTNNNKDNNTNNTSKYNDIIVTNYIKIIANIKGYLIPRKAAKKKHHFTLLKTILKHLKL